MKKGDWHGESLITGQKDPMWRSLQIAATSSVQAWTVLVEANRTENATTAPSSSSGLWLYHSKRTIHPSIAQLQYTYRHAFPPSLLSQNTQKRGENRSPHKKSRWEYIIWSEKQFVLAISCLCAKVISLSSCISAGSSYWVGGGHYTTWLQNLHRPLQRPGSLSERNPQRGSLCQIMFWLRLDDNSPHWFYDGALWELASCRACVYAKAEVELAICYEHQTVCDV